MISTHQGSVEEECGLLAWAALQGTFSKLKLLGKDFFTDLRRSVYVWSGSPFRFFLCPDDTHRWWWRRQRRWICRKTHVVHSILCELEHMALSCREWECEETAAGTIVIKDCFSLVFSTTVFCVKLKRRLSFPCYVRANSISSKSFFVCVRMDDWCM